MIRTLFGLLAGLVACEPAPIDPTEPRPVPPECVPSPEVCDGVDNDCDGAIDDFAKDGTLRYYDRDGDGFGAGLPVTDCGFTDLGPEYVVLAGDCDDEDAQIFPSAEEICDGLDQDCDQVADDGLPTQVFFRDDDGDGFGVETDQLEDCRAPAGYVVLAGDCDDGDSAVHPLAKEVCDGLDQDCDGDVDEDLKTRLFFLDGDGDGFGGESSVRACRAPADHVAVSGDCDDFVGSIFPGAPELCDEVDQDCDGVIDEDLTTLTAFLDGDGDGFGGVSIEDCQLPPGTVAVGGDCDDTDPSVLPGASDLPDPAGLDRNCDGVDGAIDDLVFVDPAFGHDANSGTVPQTPVQSVRRAVDIALATGRAWVALGAGPMSVAAADLEEGVSLAGGFDPAAGWDRTGVTVLETDGGLRLAGWLAFTEWQGLEVRALPAQTSSFALRLVDVRNLTLSSVTLRASDGLDGAQGAAGEDAMPAPDNAQAGEDGSAIVGCQPGLGGSGGGSSLGGGDGGAGGDDVSNGEPGDDGGPTTAIPGTGATTLSGGGADGRRGGDGDDGVDGVDGVGASYQAAFSDVGFTASSGQDGGTGERGAGGGGGSGGNASAVSDATCRAPGGGGGGGGAGGLGGRGGQGGHGGGASVGLLVVDSEVELVDVTLVPGRGGRGGDGGPGGAGRPGAPGAPGGAGAISLQSLSSAGDGGPGGAGGRGGDGGRGGGGSGGPAIGVVCVGTSSLVESGTTIQLGLQGQGGAPGGGEGVSLERDGC